MAAPVKMWAPNCASPNLPASRRFHVTIAWGQRERTAGSSAKERIHMPRAMKPASLAAFINRDHSCGEAT